MEQVVKELSGELLEAGKSLTATCQECFPSEADLDFHQNFPEFRNQSQAISTRSLCLIKTLHNLMVSDGDPMDVDSLVEDHREVTCVVDLLDSLYEVVDKELHSEERSRTGAANSSRVTDAITLEAPVPQKLKMEDFRKPMLIRPQASFGSDFDNSNVPFVPKIRVKTHAIIPLDEMYRRAGVPFPSPEETRRGSSSLTDQGAAASMDVDGPTAATTSATGRRLVVYPHPYEPELLEWRPSDEQLRVPQCQVEPPMEVTKCTWVATVHDLDKMVAVLESQSEFAIDLEHHSFHSYLGFVCLMQVSTRTEDFLVDTLEVRPYMHRLLDCFTNPKITKVVHGADSDVVWLQRDFGLYLVNVFDTGQAARVLDEPCNLGHLLNFYCSVSANKQYQRADWRLRPLSQEMLKYAREDTHYLLSIYDRLRVRLYERGAEKGKGIELLHSAWIRSRDVCLLKFERPLFHDGSFQEFLLRSRKETSFTQDQLRVFRALFKWRDFVARFEDESTGSVLQATMLFNVSESAPRTTQELLQKLQPVPVMVSKYKSILSSILSKAWEDNFDFAEEFERISAGEPTPVFEVSTFFGVLPSLGEITPTKEHARSMYESPILSQSAVRRAAGWVQEQSHDAISRSIQAREEGSDEEGEEEFFVNGCWEDTDEDAEGSFLNRVPPRHGREAIVPQALQHSRLFADPSQSAIAAADAATWHGLYDSASMQERALRLKDVQDAFSASLRSGPAALIPRTHDDSMSGAAAGGVLRPVRKHSAVDATAEFETLEGGETMDASCKQEVENASRPEALTPTEENVPQSLTEIYRLSKKNRRRNRERKRNKSDQPGDGAVEEEVDGGGAEKKRSKKPLGSNSSSMEEAVDKKTGAVVGDVKTFLKSVGWLKQEAPGSAPEVKAQPTQPIDPSFSAQATYGTSTEFNPQAQPCDSNQPSAGGGSSPQKKGDRRGNRRGFRSGGTPTKRGQSSNPTLPPPSPGSGAGGSQKFKQFDYQAATAQNPSLALGTGPRGPAGGGRGGMNSLAAMEDSILRGTAGNMPEHKQSVGGSRGGGSAHNRMRTSKSRVATSHSTTGQAGSAPAQTHNSSWPRR